MSQILRVKTPFGEKFHGTIRNEPSGIRSFHRVVGKRDLMRIFNAWAIHPDAWKTCIETEVTMLSYFDKNERVLYRLSFDYARDLFEQGKIFKKEFAGGETIYIPLQYFEKKQI